MDFKITERPEDLPEIGQPLYLTSRYLSKQNYSTFNAAFSSQFVFAFQCIDGRAISIPKSPFGSIYGSTDNPDSYKAFMMESISGIKSSNCVSLEVTNPPSFYKGFPSPSMMQKHGFQQLQLDINQQILLNDSWEERVHDLQKKKLLSLQERNFTFRRFKFPELKTVYDFIKVCRQTQGLAMELSWDELQSRFSTLSSSYDCFGVFRDSKISAVAIIEEVTDRIAYYYMAATSPLFRSESPMVLLIDGLVKHYRQEGFQYLDLGSSSVNGKVQEPLRTFKERMGALQSEKHTYLLRW